jgi:G:T-mismatch repair DNA endonuclease (very short patch repair protein)
VYKIEMNPKYRGEVQGIDIENTLSEMSRMFLKRHGLIARDRFRFVAANPNFKPSGVIAKSYFSLNEQTPLEEQISSYIMETIRAVLTSDEEVRFEDTSFILTGVHNIEGRARVKVTNLERDLVRKSSIYHIVNKDNLCTARAIVVALVKLDQNMIVELGLRDKVTLSTAKDICKGNDKKWAIQRDLARKLLDKCDVPIPVEGRGLNLDDIRKIERTINVQINIVDKAQMLQIIYAGEFVKNRFIYLLKDGDHFDVITSMKALYCVKDFCHLHKKKIEHSYKCNLCESTCSICDGERHVDVQYDEYGSVRWMYCEDCYRYFYNQTCYERHKRQNGRKVCGKVWKCQTCKNLIERKSRTPETHRCGERMCHNCYKFVEGEHECYMQKKHVDTLFGRGTEKYTEKYYFFDFECDQSRDNIHVPNWCGVMNFNLEKVKEFYKNEECIKDEFCTWMISEENAKSTFIAHYAKGYDSQIILQYCVNNAVIPNVIYRGSKIMLMELPFNIRVIDFLNFVQSPLAALPKTFGFEKEIGKGDFPHLFNTRDNQEYVGGIPETHYYSPGQKKEDERAKFLTWHAEKKTSNYVFDFKKELQEYGWKDVHILAKAAALFRSQFLDLCNVDPFQFLTIATTCMAVYRVFFMPVNTIAVVNRETIHDKYSKKSICWLDYVQKKEGVAIQHALTSMEKTIYVNGKPIRIDGWNEEARTVYQFHGCYWHGCPRCFKPDTLNYKTRMSMDDLYTRTLRVTDSFRQMGLTVIEKWECDFDNDGDIRQFRNKEWHREIVEPLNPRDALYGGRTETTKLLYTKGKLRYIDVNSMYPAVMFYERYPTGHQRMIKSPKEYDKSWFGLIKSKVIPPRGLYHPVLPVKMKIDGEIKLVFTLCRTCAKYKIEKCNHSDDERALIGTWTTPEFEVALEKEYKVEKVYEVWHFDLLSTDLFKGYIKTFMKIKVEASIDPVKMSEAEINKIIADHALHYDIVLERDKMRKNEGLRAIAKLCLNNLWGKFGQRDNMSKNEFVYDVKKYNDILFNDKLDDIFETEINEEVVQMNWKLKDAFVENNYNTNIFIAAFTTSYARIKLYRMLDYLGEQVAYEDTDSIVYVDGKRSVETSDLLGEWKDELGGDHGESWLCPGPKSYDLECANPKNSKFRWKGFTLNYNSSQVVNRESVKDLILRHKALTVPESRITIDRETKNLVTKIVEKKFDFKFNKRLINKICDDHIDTIPYGY